MSTIYHCKNLNTLIIDWMVLQGNGPCYSSLLGSMKNNHPDIKDITLTSDRRQSPPEFIWDICQQAGIKTVVLLNPFSYLGLQRTENIIQTLRKTIGRDCRIILGGAEETVCGEILKPNAEEGIPVIQTLSGDDITESMEPDSRIPIGNNSNAISQEKRDLCASLLGALGCEDAIEVRLPGQTPDVPYSCWDSDWTIRIDANHTVNTLLETIDEHIHRLECTSIAFAGDVFRSPLWPRKKALVSWLETLHKRYPSISLTIQDSPQILDESFLQELHGMGLRTFRIQLSPSCLSPQKAEILHKMPGALAASGILPAICGHLVTERDPPKNLRKMWTLCDRIGLDFIEMLGATPIAETNGWCGEICHILSQSPSLFLAYRCAREHTELAKKRPNIYGKLHPSIPAFYYQKFEHTRNWLLGEMSKNYIFTHKADAFQQVRQDVYYELTDTSRGLLGVSGKSQRKTRISASITSKGDASDTAVVVVANNNELNLRLCLYSIFLYTNHRYDLFVADCSNFARASQNIPCPGRSTYEHLPHQGLRSFATAWGINRVWQHNQYRYVLILDSNACALETDWLSEMIAELEQSPDIGAVGIRYDQLDYNQHEKDEGAAYLRDYVLSPGWRQGLGLSLSQGDKTFLQQLSVEGKSCFTELTGWIQLYRGDVLRRIGLPIVDDTRLKHYHWDSESSMRAVACGYRLLDSTTARQKLRRFQGSFYNSGIDEVSSYQDGIDGIKEWLAENEHTILVELLLENLEEGMGVQPSYYGWCYNASDSFVHSTR